jgi:Na+/H+ antiporter NhaA
MEQMSVSGWVKTALMPIFFFVVGLEIKTRSCAASSPTRAAWPCRCWRRPAGWSPGR